MRRGIPVRRSRAAGWARLSGGLALPVLALGVFGARIGLVPQPALEPVLVVGFVLGLAALGLGVYSLADIWYSGAGGARSAVIGIFYASPVLVILGLVAAAAIAYPRLNDISTDLNDPPLFIGMAAPAGALDAGRAAIQQAAYPDIASHLYPAPLGDVYLAVLHIVEDRRWTLIRDVHPDVMPESLGGTPEPALIEDADLLRALALKSVVTQSRGGMATETRPEAIAANPLPAADVAAVAPSNEATLDVLATTAVFGFLDDVVIRVRLAPDGTIVDMRSASRVGVHDLGENARRIRRFFADLDVVLQPEPGAAPR